MTISTSLFYDRSLTAMQRLSQRADTLSTQISNQKTLLAPSDDSVAYQRLATLNVASEDDAAWGKNLNLASSTLALGDSTLSSITNQLQRATQIATQASNGTYSATDRKAFATEIEGILETLVGLANTKDANGQPLFGGADGGAAATVTDGVYGYADKAPSAVPIGDGQSIQASETAARIFKFGGTDTLTVLAGLSAALKGDGDIGTALDDLQDASTQVADVQGSLGVRAARVDLEQARLTTVATDRDALRSKLEGSTADDVTAMITRLQQTMTALQATQASFTKLQSLSLFDYLK